jgi:hypothetical protein
VAKLPSASVAEPLQRLLHVPLDSVLMKFIKDEFPKEYREHVEDACAKHVSAIATKHADLPKAFIRDSLFNDAALAKMSKTIYLAWQDLLRSLHPERPILLDTIWATQRRRAAEA